MNIVFPDVIPTYQVSPSQGLELRIWDIESGSFRTAKVLSRTNGISIKWDFCPEFFQLFFQTNGISIKWDFSVILSQMRRCSPALLSASSQTAGFRFSNRATFKFQFLETDENAWSQMQPNVVRHWPAPPRFRTARATQASFASDNNQICDRQNYEEINFRKLISS